MSINRFSKVFVPSEYTPPFDLNAYGMIGQQKEQEFNQHLQMLQSGLDQVASQTDLIRPADQQAFRSKLADIVNKVNQHGNEDLGDPTVLSNMQGMGRSIYGDPDLIKAIGETQTVRKQQAQVEDDRKKGKLAPQNEDAFNEQLASWMDPSDTTVGKTFNGAYIPHYEYSKKLMDTLSKMQASGTVEQTTVSGGLQTQVKKTKDLSLDELITAAQGELASDPQAQQQMAIDAHYLAKRMRPEDITTSFQSSAATIAADYQQQLIGLQQEKERAVQKGNKDAGPYYDGKIKEVNDVIKKYSGYADPANTAATYAMINKDKDYYYGQVFNQDFVRNAASVFVKHDESVSRMNNLDAVMEKNYQYAIQLAKYKASLKTAKPDKPDGIVFNAPANAENNAVTESQLLSKKDELTTQIDKSKSSLRNTLSVSDPNTLGLRYKDPKKGSANWEEDYQKLQKQYNEGDTKDMDPNVVNHFQQLAESNTTLQRINQQMDMVNADLLKNPDYIRANQQTKALLTRLPALTSVVDSTGRTAVNLTRDDVFQINNILQKEDYLTKKDAIVDKKGVAHDFEYKLLNGSSPAIRQINAQIEANLSVAKAHMATAPMNWRFSTGGIADTAIESFMRHEGVLPFDYVPGSVMGEIGEDIANTVKGSYGASLLGGLGTVVGGAAGKIYDTITGHPIGRVMDIIYKADGTNHNNIDKPLTSSGFYANMGNSGTIANNIKNDAYNKAGIATMQAIHTFDLDKDTQDRIKGAVASVLPYFGEAGKLNDVINVTRNTVTGAMRFTYTTGKDDKQQTVEIPPGLEGTFASYFPQNPMKDVEGDLKRMSSYKELTHPGAGAIASPVLPDPNTAYTVPGTTIKVRYFYHPDSHLFGYRFYAGNGVWNPEIHVESLATAQETIQQAAIMQQKANASTK